MNIPIKTNLSRSLARPAFIILACAVVLNIAQAFFAFKTGSATPEFYLGLGLLNLTLFGSMFYFLRKKVIHPLREISKSAHHISKGNFTDKLELIRKDEIGNLARSVNHISDNLKNATMFVTDIAGGDLETEYIGVNGEAKNAKTLPGSLIYMREQMKKVAAEDKERSWANEGLAKFAEILRAHHSLDELSKIIIKNLVQYVNLNQGGLFLVKDSDNGKVLELISCYAYERQKYVQRTVEPGEGILGQAYLEAETVYMTDVPESYVQLTSGLGGARPRAVLMVPLKVNEEVYGMIELAGFNAILPYQINFIEKLAESIASTISSVKINEQTKKLLEESQQLAINLREQEEELRQNAEEIQATQEEVARRFEEFNKRAKFDQLTSIRSTKKRNIEDYFSIIRNQILSYAEDKMIIDAMKAFKASFPLTVNDQSPEKLNDMSGSVKNYYNSEYLTRLNANSDYTHTAEEYWSNDPVSIYLQYLYISNNPHPTGKKYLLNTHNDETEYSKAHAMYHPIIRNFLNRFGYYDIFLIDNETGHIVYSVFKEADYATSLISGPYKNTNFARVFQEAKDSTDRNFVKLADFEPYDPSYTAPASFIATSIYDENNNKIGVLVFQMPIDKINLIMTGGQNWKEDGLGHSGETYLVGEDFKMRSMSRFLIEEPDNYFRALNDLGYNSAIINKIKRLKTCILLQDVETEAVKAALSGKTGNSIVSDYRGISVLSSYTKLQIPDVNWVILSDIDEAEVTEAMQRLSF